jgi:hypothetical protein
VVGSAATYPVRAATLIAVTVFFNMRTFWNVRIGRCSWLYARPRPEGPAAVTYVALDPACTESTCLHLRVKRRTVE